MFIYLFFKSPKENVSSSFNTHVYNNRDYKLYVPSDIELVEALPLVVMLHGCTQNPDTFANATRMNEIAEKDKFLVLYPKQSSLANLKSCWNWFSTTHQSRGQGEPALIVGMVDDVKEKYQIDNNQVYVAGFSAGGAMSVILGVTYPDVFKAVGVGAGLEYKAVTNAINAADVMKTGGPNPFEQGVLAYQAMIEKNHIVPIIVFHGSLDPIVVVENGNQIISQWATTLDLVDDGQTNGSIDDVADEVITKQVPSKAGKEYTQYIYHDQFGNIIMEKYLINKMSHAWSGGPNGSYTDPNGPDQSLIFVEFFMSSANK